MIRIDVLHFCSKWLLWICLLENFSGKYRQITFWWFLSSLYLVDFRLNSSATNSLLWLQITVCMRQRPQSDKPFWLVVRTRQIVICQPYCLWRLILDGWSNGHDGGVINCCGMHLCTDMTRRSPCLQLQCGRMHLLTLPRATG